MDMSRGSRRIRLEDVAARVGMSPASVSMVLSGAPGPSAATRERVLEAAAELAALGRQLPVVVVGRRVPGGGVDVVRSADADGVGQAVDHLTGLGHTRIAYVDGGRGTIAADRRRGYRRTMHAHGLDGHLRVIGGDHT